MQLVLMAQLIVAGQKVSRTLIRTQHISIYLVIPVAKNRFGVSGVVLENNVLKYSRSLSVHQRNQGWFKIFK